MSQTNHAGSDLKSFIRRNGPVIIGVVVIAVIAFFFGYIISPDDQADSDHNHGTETASAPTTWTCSMHPQIQLPGEGKCPICFMDLIPLNDSAGDLDNPRQLKMTETAKQIARIQTTAVRRAFQKNEIGLTGKLAIDESRIARVTARFPGRIERLYADYTGKHINAGESLADIYSPELIAAQQELMQASQLVNDNSESATSILAKSAVITQNAAREKLRHWGLTDVQIDVIENSDEYYETMSISSPIRGTVVDKTAVEGSYISTGEPLYTIADLSTLWLMLDAYESDLVWLGESQDISFSVAALPDRFFEGTISFIDPTINPETRTVSVRVIVSNKNNLLKPDMFARAQIESFIDANGQVVLERGNGTGNKAQAPLLIPASAPLITGTRAVVYIELDSDAPPLFEGREVTLGPRVGDFYIVNAGIEEGENVVTNGAFKIDSELQIQARPSMMSPEGGSPPPGHDHNSIPAVHTSEENSRHVASESQATLKAITPVYESYFDLQMALADDNLKNATSEYKILAGEIESVDMSLFSMDGHEVWMKHSSTMLKQSRRGSKAEDIETSRDAFFHLSNAMIEVHDTFGHANEENFYLAYCPMARNYTGAYWLQKANIIWNSYWGDRMLRCGEIRDSNWARSEVQ